MRARFGVPDTIHRARVAKARLYHEKHAAHVAARQAMRPGAREAAALPDALRPASAERYAHASAAGTANVRASESLPPLLRAPVALPARDGDLLCSSDRGTRCEEWRDSELLRDGVYTRPVLPSRVVLLVAAAPASAAFNVSKAYLAAARTNRAYAEHHGYAFRTLEVADEVLLSKIVSLQTALDDGFQLALWLGSEYMIGNATVRLAELMARVEQHLLLSASDVGRKCDSASLRGAWLLRASPWSTALLRRLATAVHNADAALDAANQLLRKEAPDKLGVLPRCVFETGVLNSNVCRARTRNRKG